MSTTSSFALTKSSSSVSSYQAMDTIDKTSAVADFWLAVGRNNLEEAEAAVL